MPRPTWLPAIDIDVLGKKDLKSLAREILSREPVDDFQSVLLRIPLDTSLDEFGELEIAAHFVSDDFQLGGNQILSGQSQLLQSSRYEFAMIRPSLSCAEVAGKSGSAIPVCCNEQPSIHGYWHDDYYQCGLWLPAPYCFQHFTFQQARADGIYVSIGEEEVGSLALWHDAWTPMYAPNSSTRCGTISRIKRVHLTSAVASIGRKVGWFVRLSRMEKRENGYERSPTDISAFFYL